MLENERLEVSVLQQLHPDAILKVKEFRGDTFVSIRRQDLPAVAATLRDDPRVAYKYFVECLGADYSRWEHDRDLTERFEVIYNLFSLLHNSRIFLKVGVDDGQKIPSLIPIYQGAEYPQREVTDLFGIVFEGAEPTPGQRFLLPDDWVGFPLRKEYPLGGDDVLFDKASRGPAVEDVMMPHAGESFEGRTGTEGVSGR
jgi:NADH-quinone oxidoreductase subunit C